MIDASIDLRIDNNQRLLRLNQEIVTKVISPK